MKHLALFLKRAHRFKTTTTMERFCLRAHTQGGKKYSRSSITPSHHLIICGLRERNSRLFQRWRNDETHFAPEWVGWHIQRGDLKRLSGWFNLPDCLIKPTKIYGLSDDTIVVKKYMKPMRHAVENLSYFIPKTCYVFTSKNHIKTILTKRTVEKSFNVLARLGQNKRICSNTLTPEP